MLIESILSRLKNVKTAGKDRWQAACPAHEDNHASLAIAIGDQGKVLLHCHAGCTFESVIKAIHLTAADLSQEEGRPMGERKEPEAVYQYGDEHGKLLYEVCRYPGKKFLVRRPNGDGTFSWGLGDCRRVLYNLPALVVADTKRPVLIVEGEKDVDRLTGLGVLATCNPGGAGKWRDDYNRHFKGRDVVVIPDNDPVDPKQKRSPGMHHAHQVATAVSSVARRVDVVVVPTGPKGDISDWLDAGGDKRKLWDLIKQSRMPRATRLDEAERELDIALKQVNEAIELLGGTAEVIKRLSQRD